VADHRLPMVKSESLSPLVMSSDGQQVFAADYTPTWSGVVAVSATSHQRLRILEFAHPDRDQLLGEAFDSRWLIFSVTRDMRAADGTTYTWDSRTGHVRQLPSQPRRGAVPIPGAVYRPADAHPRLVAGRDDSSEVTENPAIAGQLIMWTTSERAFAADRRSASATTITPYWGWATGQRPAFFVAYPVPMAKSLHAAQNVSVLPASLLPPLPRCR